MMSYLSAILQVFTFIPSLIWVPLKWREVKDITVPLEPVLRKAGIQFIHTDALEVDPEAHILKTKQGDILFDNIVIATGPQVFYDVAPGVREYVHYIGTPAGAMKTRKALEELKKNPGPVVIGATQNAGCMGAAYVHYVTGVGIEKAEEDLIHLTNGQKLPYKFSMLMPPFHGVDFVKKSVKLEATPAGYIPVNDAYQHLKYEHVWAAGIAIDVKPPFVQGEVPFSVPKTGFPADEAGKTVAENIIRISRGEHKLKEKPFGKIPGLCIMDAGKKEVIIISNHLFKPRQIALMIPNVFYDFSKRMFEKYFLWKTRNGYSRLP